MRKYIVLAALFISLFIDFVFFDYDFSDLFNKKEDTTELVDKVKNSMKVDFPAFFESSGFIRNCKDFYKYKPKAANAFERENLRNLHKYCNLIQLLVNAKNSKESFIDKVYLTDYEVWSADLYFRYGCAKTDLSKYDEILKNNKTVRDLIASGILSITMINQDELIVLNKITGLKFHIKEMFRTNFDDDKDKTKDLLVAISQADVSDSYVECTKYIVFSRDNANEVLAEKEIQFNRKKMKRYRF